MDPNLLRHLRRGRSEHVPGRRRERSLADRRHHRAIREEEPWT